VRAFLEVAPAAGGVARAPVLFPELTERERAVLELLARGLDNTDIAARLFLSPKTVRNRISCIFDKLNVHTRGQAIVRAREGGLGQEPATPPRT